MFRILYYGTVVSAIVPATFLFIVSLFILITLGSSFPLDLEDSLLLTQSVLGIFGYFGLLMILIENHGERRKVILVFLAMGIASFLVSVCLRGQAAFKWLAAVEEPGEWLVLVWPVAVSIFHIFIIVKRLPTSPVSNKG